jgi:hypothetical protein
MGLSHYFVDTNHYLHEDLAVHNRPSTSATQDMKKEEIYHFLALTVCMYHYQRDSITDYRLTTEHLLFSMNK